MQPASVRLRWGALAPNPARKNGKRTRLNSSRPFMAEGNPGAGPGCAVLLKSEYYETKSILQ